MHALPAAARVEGIEQIVLTTTMQRAAVRRYKWLGFRPAANTGALRLASN